MQNSTACSPSKADTDATGPAAPGKGVALVVDDDPTNRKILIAMMQFEGYRVIAAEDGAQAVQRFAGIPADIVLMDVMMPVMDGYEATARIKAMAGGRFVPVIFLTALQDDAALEKCIESGGDDFLVKPYKIPLLHAKIAALERIRDLHRTLETQRAEIDRMYHHMQREEEIAEHVFSGAVCSENVALPQIQAMLRPAVTFSGDLLLTAHSPSGDLHVLMGDFTGHGLSAAIGALPASEVFRAMTAKGYPIADILSAINHKLRRLLPRGMFMAACCVAIAQDLRTVSIWNANMPDVLVLDAAGRLKHRAGPEHLPLGIRPESEMTFAPARLEIEPGDRILLCSDGVLEAQSPSGERFGSERYLRAVLDRRAPDSFNAVLDALDTFCAGRGLDDDASLADIPCIQDVLGNAADAEAEAGIVPSIAVCQGRWEWTVSLHGPSLRQANPVPLAVGYLQEIGGLQQHSQQLFTVLSELYNNALDHGVLGLDSALKASGDGFMRYYEDRETRLDSLEDGFVSIQMEHRPRAQGGEIAIRVRDSGQGFDPALARMPDFEENSGFSGRGIQLIRGLCASVHYRERGTLAEAVYVYTQPEQ